MPIDCMGLYERVVLRHPRAVLVLSALIVLTFGWFTQDFALDATADSLTLEHDEALTYYRSVRARYGSDDSLVVTFEPASDLFSASGLDDLVGLRDALRALPAVQSVVSILDVPLVSSPPIGLREFPDGLRRLEDSDTDRQLARTELLTSPLYRNHVISEDGQTTALRVMFEPDNQLLLLRKRRDELRERQLANDLNSDEVDRLHAAESGFNAYSHAYLERQRLNIVAVRQVLEEYRHTATIYLGGVPMIIADSMEFIRHDLVLFGIAVVIFLIVILATAFRQPRWIVLPLVTCIATCASMVGFLGLVDWRVTVVSSNFLSLLLIMCLALTLHIIVRYRETQSLRPDADQLFLVRETVRRIALPCFYTALTTMVAFGSLVVSGIRPVIDFGWMMVIGIAIAFVFSFTLFPAMLLLLSPGSPRRRHDVTAAITAYFARITVRHSAGTLLMFTVLIVIGMAGITRLTVENRFIDYYRKSTEIYQGMELIDRKLGGTTPLEVIIDAPEITVEEAEEYSDDSEFEDIYADADEGEAGITATSYWFNAQRLPQVMAIHTYLESLSETGKVLSLATTAQVLQQIEPGILKDNIDLSILFKKMPDDVRDVLIEPYLSPDYDQLRFSIRVYESDPNLHRSELLAKIKSDLAERFGIVDEQVHVSGMLVLYNNMLQSLFRSQILTLGAVFFTILMMFVVLFRSLRLAVIAIIPNVTSAVLVLGMMGWLGIPLDLMTITIAAITIGIAVDNTIHYVHRFDHEFSIDRNYWAAVKRSHRTIGRAMYYTSVTIMLGFSVLTLSQFVPTIYFGLLTGFAMLVALLANMTLLPALLVKFHGEGRRYAAPATPVT